jgi:hypothetical protein
MHYSAGGQVENLSYTYEIGLSNFSGGRPPFRSPSWCGG